MIENIMMLLMGGFAFLLLPACALLLIAIGAEIYSEHRKKPPTKDEWKQM